MPSYTNPGVYVSESTKVSQTQQGNTTRSAAAFFGEALRGPTTATFVDSWASYKALFGELNQSYELGFAVYHYFANGGKEAYINRVLASNAVKATSTVSYFPNGNGQASAALFTATAVSAGTWGNGLTYEITAGSVSPTASVIPTFNLVIKLDGAEVERWNELSVDPSNNRNIDAVLDNYSKFVTVSTPSAIAKAAWAWSTVTATSSSGSNGTAIVDQDYVDALGKIDTIEGVLLLNAVGKTSNTIVNAFLNKAETRGNSFVIIDPDAAQTDYTTIGGTVVGSYTASSYGAVYYPALKMVDPSKSGPGAIRTTYPGGAIAGAYIRNEVSRTVAKAPAGSNVEVRNALGLLTQFTELQTGVLYNTYNVNMLKAIPGGGIIINGARTLSKSTPDKFIPIRRSLNFLKQAMKDVTSFAVFEPNDERLWNRLNMVTSSLLSEFWRAGGLKGANADQAYYIVCNSTNNTATTINNGEVHIEVGVALQYPAEYVVINISQWTGGSNTVETL